jgi:hypothetical protein
MSAPLDARVLEIGSFPVIAASFPAETSYVHLGPAGDAPRGAAFTLTLARWPALLRLLREKRFDLVVVNPTRLAPWSPGYIGRAIFSRDMLRGEPKWPRALGQLAPLLARAAPLAVLDFEDTPLLFAHHRALLRASRLYFKRELPADRWRLATGLAPTGIPSERARRVPAALAALDRLRPLPLGLPSTDRLALVPAPLPKTADVFFAGAIHGRSTQRPRALAELRAMPGLRLDIPNTPLPPAAFMARMAAAHLVLSPEGLGWDCFRHYEAPAAWSVPVMNFPPIERAQPLRHGEHCILHDVTQGALAAAVQGALADPARLARMAAAARAHVALHHTPAAIARYVVRTALTGCS